MNKLITLLALISISAFSQEIELPKDIQKKLKSIDSVIQVVNKQYEDIVTPLQAQQRLIIETAFSMKGVDVNKIDSIRYENGKLIYKSKKK